MCYILFSRKVVGFLEYFMDALFHMQGLDDIITENAKCLMFGGWY